MKVKSVLVSQPEPDSRKSPYFELAEKYSIKIDFRPFINIEGITAREFRQTRIQFTDYTAVIFTSRTAIDHFFRISQELKFDIPDTMKYFCISEATAFYLHKYIVYRKRKIFHADGRFADLINVMKKHPHEKFLVPLADIHKQEIPELLDKAGYNYTKAILYRTVISDLSELKKINYDILIFFSPSDIKSLFHNFPNFKQNSIRIACFGASTASAVLEAGLRLDIEVPTAQAPSMTMALEQYIIKTNK